MIGQGYAPSLILFFMMKKLQNYLVVFMMVLMGTVVFSSCGGDDDDNPGGGSNNKSWFIEVSQEELNGVKADLTTYDPLSKRQEIVDEISQYGFTDPNKFRSDYMNHNGVVDPGYCCWDYFKNFPYGNGNVGKAWHIVDKSTIEVYYNVCFMYGDSKNIARRLIHVGSWNYWGDIYLAVHKDDSEPSIYSYVKSDNKIILSNGDIFHLYDNYVVEDGGSRKMMWFTPLDR